MSAKKVNSVTNKEANVDLEKREFMGKVGKYAAVGVGMATLMTPTASSANSYGTACSTYKRSEKKFYSVRSDHRSQRADWSKKWSSWSAFFK